MSATTTSLAASATATCTHPKPGKNGYLPPEACDVILLYVPSLAAAILFCVLFGLSLIAHLIQAYMFKKWYAWTVIMGALWELLAFVFRALHALNQNKDGFHTGHTIMFLLAPLWINAFLYMTLGRLIYFFIPDQRLGGISAQRFGKLFVWLDVVAFIVQLAGAAITTDTEASTKTTMMGVHIYMGGIGLQQFFIIVFTLFFAHLHRRMLEMERIGQLDSEKLNRGSGRWRWLFYGCYAALGLITIRIIYRLAQYSRGTDPDNPVLTHEWYEYVFDAMPSFFALIAINVFHPGQVLQGPGSEFPHVSRKEKKRIKREEKAAKRAEKEARKDERYMKRAARRGGHRDSIAFDSLTAQEAGYYQQPQQR